MIAEIVSLIAFLIENCTGVAIVQSQERSADEETLLIQVSVEEKLQDFTKFDPDDALFREYDPPPNEEEDPKAWRKNRPKLKTSIWDSFKYVFLIQTVSGTALGALTILVAFLDFNSADLCYGGTTKWDKMPHAVGAVRVTGQAVEGFIIEMWDYLLLSTVFPWSILKELNLLTLNLLAAFVDMSYRLYFQLYGIYKIWWMSFPLNALFTSMVIINSFILARHFKPRPWLEKGP